MVRRIVVGLLIVLAGGCEAIVGSDLPAYTCFGSDPSSCPTDMYCSNSACVACDAVHCGSGDASVDTGSPDAAPDTAVMDTSLVDTAPPTDGALDGPTADALTDSGGSEGGCTTAGCACAASTDCTSGICGGADALGATFDTAHGSICVDTCCSAANCPTGFVCYGPGTGGSYCVPSTDLGRPATLGASAPGATCVADGDCRSGKCQTGRCVDLCCGDTDCTNGTSCSLDTGGLDGHQVFACLLHPGAASHAACTMSSQCADNDCQFSSCRPRCCGLAGCMTAGFNACVLDMSGPDSIYVCDYPSGPPSGSAFGQTCTKSTDCASRICDTTNSVCTQGCCNDADCTSLGNYVCRPAGAAPYNLICTKP